MDFDPNRFPRIDPYRFPLLYFRLTKASNSRIKSVDKRVGIILLLGRVFHALFQFVSDMFVICNSMTIYVHASVICMRIRMNERMHA
jgi:hypothetical protein